MAQAIAETVFDCLYLSFALIAGLTMLIKGKGPLVKKAGLMSALLGAGDAFHLIPRSYALWTTGLEANAAALGVGKLITSITMTVFYLILYYIWRERYQIEGRKGLTGTMWALSLLRAALCLLPQNRWLEYRQPLLFGILRNIPFAVMGVIIIVIFAREAGKGKDPVFRFMPLAVALSFGFYLPVVLFSGVAPAVGSYPNFAGAKWPSVRCQRAIWHLRSWISYTKEGADMSKKYADTALIYALTALVSGVFYREFTKFNGFTGRTNLAFMHTHYFLLGMFFFLALLLLEKNFLFSDGKRTKRALLLYHVGLNITGAGFLLRGLTQVWGMALSRGMDASIAGIAGIGHILLGIGLVLLLLQIRKKAA